jgi:hypothetical protein
MRKEFMTRGEDNRNVARMSLLLAGLPETVRSKALAFFVKLNCHHDVIPFFPLTNQTGCGKLNESWDVCVMDRRL